MTVANKPKWNLWTPNHQAYLERQISRIKREIANTEDQYAKDVFVAILDHLITLKKPVSS